MNRYTFAATILLLISTLNLLYLVATFYYTTLYDDKDSYSFRGHDYPENLPLPVEALPLVSMVAEESAHYQLLGPKSDKEWLSLTPSKFGYVQLGPENRLFAVSMFHQLHCLRMLNLAFGKHRIATRGHVQHCLNYLRQAALCEADLTIEPGNFEDKNFKTERTGATHTCRDWSLAYSVLEKNNNEWKMDEMESTM